MSHATHVHFLLLPGSIVLDWAGPAEALRIANQLRTAQGQPALWELHFCGASSQAISSVGAVIQTLEPFPSAATLTQGQHWLVLVGQPGECVELDHPDAQALLRWLRALPVPLRSGGVELLCVCAGAVIAAHAGLLHQRHATTHHQHLDELRTAAPTCQVQDNRVFVQDDGIYTSAGMTTGIDLFLHRIAALGGAALAAQVAQTMVVALRRGPHDPELSPFLSYRQHIHPTVHRLQDAISQQPQQDWSLPRMAELAHSSTRHVARLFNLHAGIAPLEYVQRIRLATAQAALQAGYSVTRAAEIAGFSSDGQLRRSWHALGMANSPRRSQPQHEPRRTNA